MYDVVVDISKLGATITGHETTENKMIMTKINIMIRFVILILTTLLISCNQTSDNSLKRENLKTLSLEELRLLRNEIFAKHGYIFNSTDLNEYFSSKDWYVPKYKNVDTLLTKTDKENIDLILEMENQIISSLLKIKLSDCDSLKTSINDTILLQEFLTTSKNQLEKDFKKFWNFVDGFNSIDFSIENLSIWELHNRKIAMLKVVGVGRDDNSSATAYTNYILDLNDTKINILDTTSFFQPECGTCDYTNIKLCSIILNGEFIPVVVKQTEILGCCGASDEHKREWILYSSDFSKKQLVIEKYYENENNDSCAEKANPFSRKTDIYHDKINFVLMITHYDNNVKQYTETKTIK